MPLPKAIIQPSPFSYISHYRNDNNQAMDRTRASNRRRTTIISNNHNNNNYTQDEFTHRYQSQQEEDKKRQRFKYAKKTNATKAWIMVVMVPFLFLIICLCWISFKVETTTRNNHFRNPKRYRPMKHSTATPTATNTQTNSSKIIYYYTKYWKYHDFQFGFGQEPFLKYNCPVSNCYATKDSMYQSKSDAVLFHMIDLHTMEDLDTMNRLAHQRFILFQMESPSMYGYNYNRIPSNFFNWTMTYRYDSDIIRPYGYFTPKPEMSFDVTRQQQQQQRPYWPLLVPPSSYQQQQASQPQFELHSFLQDDLPTRSKQFYDLATNRSHKVAWIVSNCNTPSQREDYVRELSKYIQVDIFGQCSGMRGIVNHNHENQTNHQDQPFLTTTTPRTCNTTYGIDHKYDNCTYYVERNYKFYLAFENSFCNDYVTEKFFSHMYNYNHENHNDNDDNYYPLVPIVMGQANYTQIAPSHSYIDVFDYPSPKHLAQYLHSLDDGTEDEVENNEKNNARDNDITATKKRGASSRHHEYLSYFWWTKYYNVHTASFSHFAKSMCDLCAKLHEHDEDGGDGHDDTATATTKKNKNKKVTSDPKSYQDIEQWWIKDAQCDTFKPKLLQQLPSTNAYGRGGFGGDHGGRLRISWDKV